MESFTEKQAQQRYRELVEDIKQRIGYAESIADGYDPLEDVVNHGAGAGWPGFTYTAECADFSCAPRQSMSFYKKMPTLAKLAIATSPSSFRLSRVLIWPAPPMDTRTYWRGTRLKQSR